MSVTTLPVSIGATPSWPANAASVAALLPFAPTVEALPSLEAPAPVAELTVLASLDAPALLALLKAASPLPLASTAGGRAIRTGDVTLALGVIAKPLHGIGYLVGEKDGRAEAEGKDRRG